MKKIDFLDLTIMKTSDGHLHTTLFHKPTDRNTLLRAHSFHPPALKQNIPFAQFQRLKRIFDVAEIQKGCAKCIVHSLSCTRIKPCVS